MDRQVLVDDQHQLQIRGDLYRGINPNITQGDYEYTIIQDIPPLIQVIRWSMHIIDCNPQLRALYNNNNQYSMIPIIVGLTIDGELLMINRQYQSGIIVPILDKIGPLTSLTEWMTQHDSRLVVIDEVKTMYIINVNDIANLNNNLQYDSYPGIVSVSTYGNRLYWLTEGHQLNVAHTTIDHSRDIIMKVITKLLTIKSVMIRDKLLVSDNNQVFRVDTELNYEHVLSVDREIIDICIGYPSTVISIIHDDGIIYNYIDGESLGVIDCVNVSRLLRERLGSMMIELDDGTIIAKDTGWPLELPCRLLNTRSTTMMRIRSGKMNDND